MGSQNRRDFLKRCAASVPALAFANGIDASKIRNHAVAQQAYRTPGSLDRYIDPLPIPKRLMPHEACRGSVQYRVRMSEFRQKMHSQLPPTKLWGFEGQYPGPIIEARRGCPVEVQWENHLPASHLFEIDPHINGARPPAPAVRTVPHLHGARTQSESDGLPEKWFVPGELALYYYPNDQPAATLWYHDLAIGITRLNVYAGLSGLYFLRDDEERSMNLPSGDYEIPLILQDRTLNSQGQLVYPPTRDDGQMLPPGFWGCQFYGDLPVVNGAIYPYLNVEPRRYRLRVLNGANSRFFHLFFNLAKRPADIPSLVNFHQIGTDGGFLPSPVALDKLLLAPGERADLIVDFSGLEGRVVTLSNNAPSPFPSWDMLFSEHAPLDELMQFRVALPISGKVKAFNMPPPIPFPKLDEHASITTRDFVLSQLVDRTPSVGSRINNAWGYGSTGLRINNKGYDETVTVFPKLGSVEKWRFINTTDDAHPMHLHLVQFRILERQGFNTTAFHNGTLELVGAPRLPAANEAGWKDTAVVSPGEVLTIVVRFEGYTGRYAFHCHMLEHEDNDMKRPYEVVSNN